MMEQGVTRIVEASVAAIDEAVGILRGGGVVAIPTETVYGLAANALDAGAVARIYEAKGRPASNPLIVHVSSAVEAAVLVAEWPVAAQRLAECFWPGPLTLVLKKRAGLVPDITTAGGDTVAVRCPDHRVALELIGRCGFPLAAPSANRSNHISPTTAEHVARSLGGRIPMVVDGGACRAGIESTVLNLAGDDLEILRPGSISAEEIGAVVERPVRVRGGVSEGMGVRSEGGAILSPGLMEKHYAPVTPLVLVERDGLMGVVERFRGEGKRMGMMVRSGGVGVDDDEEEGVVVRMPGDVGRFGEVLYATLHGLDEAGLDVIVCELPPLGPEWVAVRDRLLRAGRVFAG